MSLSFLYVDEREGLGKMSRGSSLINSFLTSCRWWESVTELAWGWGEGRSGGRVKSCAPG